LRRRFQKTQAKCLAKRIDDRERKVTELLPLRDADIPFSSSIRSRRDSVLRAGMRLPPQVMIAMNSIPDDQLTASRAMAAQRKSVDCRDYPSEKNCSLKISGTEEEVLDAAVRHAVSAHGHDNTPELREQIKSMLKDEAD
jgi:predicted small metal-binding protein